MTFAGALRMQEEEEEGVKKNEGCRAGSPPPWSPGGEGRGGLRVKDTSGKAASHAAHFCRLFPSCALFTCSISASNSHCSLNTARCKVLTPRNAAASWRRMLACWAPVHPKNTQGGARRTPAHICTWICTSLLAHNERACVCTLGDGRQLHMLGTLCVCKPVLCTHAQSCRGICSDAAGMGMPLCSSRAHLALNLSLASLQ